MRLAYRMRHPILFAAALSFLGLSNLLTGCTVNPATGRTEFTGGMSSSEEIRIGRENHPQILKEFGGEYDNPALTRYVDSIGALLAQTVERKEFTYKFTVLNSDIVNAFAVPGGYVYISRGLVALADNEAQLAAVMAHELGHLTALHHARRYGQGLLANILVTGVAIAGGSELAQLGQFGAVAVLQSYSREHEFEADDLGIRYMSRAGYDPKEMAAFLAKLRAHSQLEARLRGQSPDAVDQFDYLATHPAPAARVDRALQNASAVTVAQPMTAQAIYQSKIDGMLYGDDPEQGFIKGRAFAHPQLRFTFEVPAGFRLFNSQQAIVAYGPDNARIILDQAKKPSDGPMTYYLTDVWARGTRLSNVESIDVNGLPAATGALRLNTQSGTMDLRLVAIRWDATTIYRFIFATPPALTGRLTTDLQRTTFSFRRLSANEAAALKPSRIAIVTVGPGDTADRLAARMPFADFRRERFEVLNGLKPGQQPAVGQKVKLIVD